MENGFHRTLHGVAIRFTGVFFFLTSLKGVLGGEHGSSQPR